ncbi:MAG TPA: hypothetical protein VIJ01_07705 [Candidatus Angelobacter sp.]
MTATTAIIRPKSEHASATGPEGMAAHSIGIGIKADNGVKLVDAENIRGKTGIVIMRQEASFIEGKAMDVAMHFIKPDNVALIVIAKHERTVGAREVDGRVMAIFQHEAMSGVGGVTISPNDHTEIIDAAC